MVVIQGTTPKHNFKIPFDVSLVDDVKIIYKQGEEILLEKRKADCTMENMTISTKLTQEDTFKFKVGKVLKIQLRVLTTTKDSLVSQIFPLPVYKCLDSEVLT